MIQDIKYQRGFTLIELMISLVLGLLISAAIIQVFITSQRVDRVQSAGSEIQDSAVFGIQSIEQQLRLANLGNDGVPLNDKTVMGGVVLTASATNADAVNVVTSTQLEEGYLTRSHDMDSAGGIHKWDGSLSNTGEKSDQLTFQYTNTTGQILYDCEGEKIELNERVITRYFLTEDSVKTNKDRKNLNLNCDAGRIASNGVLTNFMEVGQTIIKNVDQFNIRLGVKHSVVNSGVVSYSYTEMSVKDYMNLTTEKPYITNIKVALLTRSTSNSPDDSASAFSILGTTQTLKSETNAPKYLRRVYETNTLLRNARIVNVINSVS
ncbi:MULTISPECIES: PilW family protein [unclassified Psychrobacter]|uniref:PilW family protein n=1 Tax=unclassified Psychrobacter TaxID=196806 RepID=UPI0020231690|nr:MULTISPECIES: PilW family protein [unclassified Psychrobacter]